jgi:hypothetical protein
LYCIVLYCIALYCIVLYCMPFHRIGWHLINLISSVVNLSWWFFCDSLIDIRIGMNFLWFDLIGLDLI